MSGRPRPFVSVIMPVRNEGRYIAACVRSLLQCSYPRHRWEIIIVDGMSEDNTCAEIARVQAASPVPIMLLENPRRVTPFALNVALAQAQGSIIIRVDAHAVYGEDYVTRCVEVLRERGADVVGGIMVASPGAETPMGRAIAVAMMHPFGVGNAMLRISSEPREVDTVPFGCFRAEVFERVGLFDERLVRNQDYEMNQRIRRSGGMVFLDPRLKLRYFSRPTLRSLLKQSWSNGFWNALCHRIHPYSMCFRHVAPLVFSFGMLAAVLLAIWAAVYGVPRVVVPVAGLLWGAYLAYLAIDIVISTKLAARHGWRLWPSFLVLFPSFHFVNGAGLLLGWARALLRWYPWRPEDHTPTWQEERGKLQQRLAA